MMSLRTTLLASLLLCTAAQAALQHALTLYNEPPSTPADFKHFDYVNPDAPKGGTFRESAMGGFDSLNPYISKGVPADNLPLIYDTLAMQSLDEPITEYGLVAGKIEKPRTTAGCVSTCAPKRASTMAIRCAPRTWCLPSRP